MKRTLFLLSLLLLVACSDGVNIVKPVFIEDLHHHAINFGHAHPIDDLDHSHNDDVLIDALLEKRLGDAYAQALAEARAKADANVVVVSPNPFSRIITDSQQILAMDGGDELLNIAVGEGSPDQKMQAIFRMRNSEVKRLLIQAYAEHGDWITEMAQKLGVPGF